VSVVGNEKRVIAETDCGFGTFAGREYVAEEIVWVKLAAAAEGARIAPNKLWGRTGGRRRPGAPVSALSLTRN
jgi:5-methyltetrahydropteroyltriglutamate--homocysteine methyltransferase